MACRPSSHHGPSPPPARPRHAPLALEPASSSYELSHSSSRHRLVFRKAIKHVDYTETDDARMRATPPCVKQGDQEGDTTERGGELSATINM